MSAIDLGVRASDFSLYFPAMQISSAKSICKPSNKWQDALLPAGLRPKDFNYIDPNNRFWHYPYALASAEHFRGVKRNAVSQRAAGAFILGDSAGFQLGNGTFRKAGEWNGFSENEIVRAWSESSMRDEITAWCDSNCNLAMTIDLPLWARRAEHAGKPFNQCSVQGLLSLTVENLEYLQHNRGHWGECKYLNVLQGDTPSEEELWYAAVKGYRFDGWSFAGGVGVNGGPYRVLNRLLTLRDEGLLNPGFDWLHLLMLSRFPWAPVVTAMQRGVRKSANPQFTISYDSSTPYKMAGTQEEFFEAVPFTADWATWSNHSHKFPTTYGDAIEPRRLSLNSTHCSGTLCSTCAIGIPHLPAPLSSPIASLLHTGDLVSVTDKYAKRHGRTLFDQTLINHNTYTIVDGTIRANEAVFGTSPNAPSEIIEAVDLIENQLFMVQNWSTLLAKHRDLLEAAVKFKPRRHVLE